MRHETLLLEIGTEELPPKSLLALKTAFAENLKKALDARQFNYSDVAAFATPRRLAVIVSACEDVQPEQLIQRKGWMIVNSTIATLRPSQHLVDLR